MAQLATKKNLTDRIVHVKDFGAVGDGTTNDATAIQAAIDYANSNGVGTVLLDAKVYSIDPYIRMKSNVTLLGPKGSTIKLADTNTGHYYAIGIVGRQNVTIKGIIIDTNYNRPTYNIAVNPDIGVYIGQNCSNIHVEDNTFNTCGIWSIVAEVNSTYKYHDNIYVERNVINYRVGKNTNTATAPDTFTVDTTQIYIDAKNYWIRDNVINCDYTDAETAIELHRRNGVCTGNIITGFRNGIITTPGQYIEDVMVSRMIVSDNVLTKCRKGINLWQATQMDLDNVIVDNNEIEIDIDRFPLVTEAKGIFILSKAPTDNNGKVVKNIQITNNVITYLPTTITKTFVDDTLEFSGINMRSWVSMENVRISGNEIINAPAVGIVAGVQQDGTYVNHATGIVITDNLIVNAGIAPNIADSAGNPKCAIRLNGGADNSSVSKCTVMNNTIVDTRGPSSNWLRTPISLQSITSAECNTAFNSVYAFGFNKLDSIVNTISAVSGSIPSFRSRFLVLDDDATITQLTTYNFLGIYGGNSSFGAAIRLGGSQSVTYPSRGVLRTNTTDILTWDANGVKVNGFAPTLSTKTANYTATGQDCTLLFNCAIGDLIASLPPASSHPSQILTFKKIDASANILTIDANASETIDGSLTKTLSAQWDLLRVQSNGSNWLII
jgi:pectate lyase-like protein